ncbi:hypothetical protein HNR60_002859 [Rhodopseudomonas rhenobacensis]|uniref:Uncharacterized protein n=1 Tax=Rhodopseudomonas rhenobacensis TaxID=87461 RepID=A0A7W7Z4Y6_9BRAD|nr:hypothetical protein [Rhodopseudomonas rhenobacensis]
MKRDRAGRGATHRSLSRWKQFQLGRRGVPRWCLASTAREAPGHRPGPLRGSATCWLAGRGTGEGGESPPDRRCGVHRACPRKHGPGAHNRRRWRAARRRGLPSRLAGVAVSRDNATPAPCGAPPPSLRRGGHFAKLGRPASRECGRLSRTHRGCLKIESEVVKRNAALRSQPSSPGLTGRPSIPERSIRGCIQPRWLCNTGSPLSRG